MRRIKQKLCAIILSAALLFTVVPINGAVYAKDEPTQGSCGMVCNFIEHMTNFLAFFYEDVVESNLVISPEFLRDNYIGSTGYALRGAWGKFRDLANLFLIIFLILIILSQITGYGISNYGIKKGLPKLLLAAVLINMSYVICQGCVDLANIFGTTISGFFEDLLAEAMPSGMELGLGGTVVSTIVVDVIAVITIYRKSLYFKIAIGVLLVFAYAFVSVALLWIVLAIRQSMAFLLVVLSPLAFASYVIPGTKSLFKTWFKTFKTLLMAYPICSVMFYGGAFAASIIYASWASNGGSGDVFKGIAFILVTVTPYYFIPATIMKSMSYAQRLMQNINSFARNTSRNFVNHSKAMQFLRANDKRFSDIARSGQRLNRKGQLVKRFGHKNIARRADPTSGRFLRARKLGNRLVNGAIVVNNVATNLNRRTDAAYRNDAINAAAAIRRQNRYSSRAQVRRGWRDIDKDGKLIEVFDSDGKRKKMQHDDGASDYGYFDKNNKFIENKRFGIVKNFYHNNVSLRFSKNNPDNFLNEMQTSISTVDRQAFMDRMVHDINMDTSKKASVLEGILRSNNPDYSEAVAAASFLLNDGEDGRRLFSELVDNMVKSAGASDIDNMRNFARNLCGSQGDMNKIKKTMPILYNKIRYLGSLSGNTSFVMANYQSATHVTEKQIVGMSNKQFATMDNQDQRKVLDDLVAELEKDPTNGQNSSKLISACTAAEGALEDPLIRASLDAEQLSMMENIAALRKVTVEDCTNKNIRRDNEILKTMTGRDLNFTAANDGSFETFRRNYTESVAETFVSGVNRGGAPNFLEACRDGDTARIESILRAIDKNIDDRMTLAGYTDPSKRSKERNALMLDVVRSMQSKSSEFSDGLYSDESNEAVKKLTDYEANLRKYNNGRLASAPVIDSAIEEKAMKIRASRKSVDAIVNLMEQRFVRRSVRG